MLGSNYTKAILTVIALLLAIIALRPMIADRFAAQTTSTPATEVPAIEQGTKEFEKENARLREKERIESSGSQPRKAEPQRDSDAMRKGLEAAAKSVVQEGFHDATPLPEPCSTKSQLGPCDEGDVLDSTAVGVQGQVLTAVETDLDSIKAIIDCNAPEKPLHPYNVTITAREVTELRLVKSRPGSACNPNQWVEYDGRVVIRWRDNRHPYYMYGLLGKEVVQRALKSR